MVVFSFASGSAACQLLSSGGVAAIFGPNSVGAAASAADHADVPYFGEEGINLKPPKDTMSELMKLARHFSQLAHHRTSLLGHGGVLRLEVGRCPLPNVQDARQTGQDLRQNHHRPNKNKGMAKVMFHQDESVSF